eukprot:gene10518-7486_t
MASGQTEYPNPPGRPLRNHIPNCVGLKTAFERINENLTQQQKRSVCASDLQKAFSAWPFDRANAVLDTPDLPVHFEVGPEGVSICGFLTLEALPVQDARLCKGCVPNRYRPVNRFKKGKSRCCYHDGCRVSLLAQDLAVGGWGSRAPSASKTTAAAATAVLPHGKISELSDPNNILASVPTSSTELPVSSGSQGFGLVSTDSDKLRWASGHACVTTLTPFVRSSDTASLSPLGQQQPQFQDPNFLPCSSDTSGRSVNQHHQYQYPGAAYAPTSDPTTGMTHQQTGPPYPDPYARMSNTTNYQSYSMVMPPPQARRHPPSARFHLGLQGGGVQRHSAISNWRPSPSSGGAAGAVAYVNTSDVNNSGVSLTQWGGAGPPKPGSGQHPYYPSSNASLPTLLEEGVADAWGQHPSSQQNNQQTMVQTAPSPNLVSLQAFGERTYSQN